MQLNKALKLLLVIALASVPNSFAQEPTQHNDEIDSYSEPVKCDITPLWEVVYKNSKKKLAKFFEKNPDFNVNCLDENGNSALILGGAYGGAYKTVPILLENGADPNIVNDYGQTAYLTYSQHRYYPDTDPRRQLAEAGADIFAVDHGGFNAIHYASASLKPRTINNLEDLGIDPKALTKNGHSAWDIAEHTGRIKGLQIATNLGQENLDYSYTLRNLRAHGVTKVKRFEGYKLTRASGVEVEISEPTSSKPQGGILGLLDKVIVKSEGTGKKCNHMLIVGNFTGLALNAQIMAKLENGNHQEYSDGAGGKFFLPSGGVSKHQIWLTQGGLQRLYLSAGGQSSRAGYIDFKISPECPHGAKSLSARAFVVEKNNTNGMLSIFEDTNGDGRRDTVVTPPASPVAVTNRVSGSRCAKIDLLATKFNEDATAMLYGDEQLVALYDAVGCSMNDGVSKQRNQIKSILTTRN